MTPLLSSALLRTQSDERLLTLAANGHDRAFEAIVDRYRRPLLRYLHRLLPGDRAEDVLQAAFVSAWTALRGGTPVRELRPWLYRICHNGALNALARRGYDHAELTETFPGAASPVEALESRDAIRQTLASLAELPERQRNALLAVAVEGRPHGDVARELGMSDGALRQLVHRARSSVRSAVTAVTPAPVVEWLAQLSARGNAPRIAELVGGAGVAGVAKAAAIVVATGAVVAGGAVHVAGHDAGPAVAAAAAPRSVVHVAPHTASTTASSAPARTRHPRTHARRRPVRRPMTVSLGGRTDRVVAPVPHRHPKRRPPTPVTVSHGGSTEQAPTTTGAAPAAPSGESSAPSAPVSEPTHPTTTEPAPTPEPCHEVACRPVTEPTPTEPPPADSPPATEPPPADPPPATEPPPSDAPRI
jgi:RNA polymerase sigma factor (sigma-70 family)